MATFAVVLHHQREEAAALARRAAAWLAGRGHDVVLPLDDAKVAGLDHLGLDDGDLPPDAAAVLSLGGDGTMLRAVALAAPKGVPILGVNVGLLGYLNEVESAQLDLSLDRLVRGEYALDERMMLSIEVHAAAGEQATPGPLVGLNEVVVEKSEPGHTIRLQVSIDGEPFTSYAADGLIVATPTGSTAYALSARGPIVSPRLQALLLTPVSPHMLFDRTLVLHPSEVVRFDVIGHRPVVLAVDGRPSGRLQEGDALVVAPAARPARLITFGLRRFHHILKTKFGLTDR